MRRRSGHAGVDNLPPGDVGPPVPGTDAGAPDALLRDLERASANGKDRQFVTALARGLEVLRAFHAGDGPLGNQEIAERTGLPKPTISRLTYTLMHLGYLSYSERLGKYQLGPAVLSLGYAARTNMTVRKVAAPYLEEVADHANAAAALGARDRLHMVYLEYRRGNDAVTLHLDAGSRIPLAETAMGKAFLAGLPETERDYLMDFLRERYGERWSAIRKGIEDAVRQVEERGFCVNEGGWHPDTMAVGVPLALPAARTLMALNCGGPNVVIDREKLLTETGPRLINAARNIQAALAGS